MATMTKTLIRLDDLSTDILCQRILPYLDQLTGLICFSQTSSTFRNLVFSSYCSSVWSSKSLDVCVDPQCLFGCGRKKISSALFYRIIENTDVVELRLHLPFCSFGTLQQSMKRNYRQSLRRLHLRFRQAVDGEAVVEDRPKSYRGNHTYDDDIHDNPSQVHKVMLNSLIVYGWPVEFPLSYLNTSQLCSHLEILHFMESSPRMLLQALHEGSTSVCPHLRELCIQGEQDVEGVSHISSNTLRVLNLRDTSFMLHVTRPPTTSVATTTQETSIPPRPFLNLPALSRLELIDNHVLNISDDEVRRMVGALPIALRELELRINSSLSNCIITELSKRLRQLEVLSLHLPDEDGESLPTNISLATVEALAAGCPALLSLETTDGLISFDRDALVALSSLSSLRRIKMMYDEDYIDSLPSLLSNSHSLEEVLFFDNADDVIDEDPQGNDHATTDGVDTGVGGVSRWHEMSESLAKIAELFPTVNLGLRDYWWM